MRMSSLAELRALELRRNCPYWDVPTGDVLHTSVPDESVPCRGVSFPIDLGVAYLSSTVCRSTPALPPVALDTKARMKSNTLQLLEAFRYGHSDDHQTPGNQDTEHLH